MDGELYMWLPVGIQSPAASPQLLSQLLTPDVSLYKKIEDIISSNAKPNETAAAPSEL